MSVSAFPPKVSAALDRLTVPPLPAGFADRLAARIAAGDLPSEAGTGLPLPPSARKPIGTTRGWARTGKIVASVALFGVATATAAASGFFGTPVYVPVVSETLAKAELVELPVKKGAPVAKAAPKPEKMAEAAPAGPEAKPEGPAAVHQLYARLRDDPSFRQLPKQQRVAIARREVAALIRSGDATRPEVRQALAEIRRELRPEIRRRIEAEVARRRERGLLSPARPQQSAPDPLVLDGQRKLPAAQPVLTPEARAARREAFEQLGADDKARVRALREQLRTAPFAERPAIRREIRAIWQSAQQSPEEKIEPASEGYSDVAR